MREPFRSITQNCRGKGSAYASQGTQERPHFRRGSWAGGPSPRVASNRKSKARRVQICGSHSKGSPSAGSCPDDGGRASSAVARVSRPRVAQECVKADDLGKPEVRMQSAGETAAASQPRPAIQCHTHQQQRRIARGSVASACVAYAAADPGHNAPSSGARHSGRTKRDQEPV